MSRKPCLALALLLPWLCLPGLADPNLNKIKKAIRSHRENLEDTQERIREENQELLHQKQKESHILEEMQSLDEDLSIARNELKTHQHNLTVVQAKLAEIGSILEKDKASLALHQEALAKRLVSLYKERSLSAVALLLSSQDPVQLINRYRFLRSLAAFNTRLLTTTRAEIQQVQQYEREYKDKEAEILRLKQEAENSRQKVLGQEVKKKKMLAGIQHQKSRIQRTLHELKRAAENLQSLVAQLEQREKDLARRQAQSRRLAMASGFHHGHILWPVIGPLVSRFGKHKHPLFGTTVFNKGIEIGAEEGTPIRAAAAGKVLYAGWFTGYGKMAILDHGGNYYTLYAHAGDLSVAVDQEVQAGQTIGEVGDTGSFGNPTLYFEVRKNGKAIDPLQWLRRGRS